MYHPRGPGLPPTHLPRCASHSHIPGVRRAQASCLTPWGALFPAPCAAAHGTRHPPPGARVPQQPGRPSSHGWATGHPLHQAPSAELRNTRGHCMPRPPQVFPGEAPVTTPLH